VAFVQRDLILTMIEQLAAGLARALAGKKLAELPPEDEVDPELVARAAGLGVDLACALPAQSVIDIVGDSDGLVVLGLAIGRMAWRASDPVLAGQALALLAAAEPLEPAVREVREALRGLAR
jgi:hypothetical protein